MSSTGAFIRPQLINESSLGPLVTKNARYANKFMQPALKLVQPWPSFRKIQSKLFRPQSNRVFKSQYLPPTMIVLTLPLEYRGSGRETLAGKQPMSCLFTVIHMHRSWQTSTPAITLSHTRLTNINFTTGSISVYIYISSTTAREMAAGSTCICLIPPYPRSLWKLTYGQGRGLLNELSQVQVGHFVCNLRCHLACKVADQLKKSGMPYG